MTDQAQALRKLASSQSGNKEGGPSSSAKIITVTSGKGGVGKSNFTLNFALALQAMGQKVLIFDADIGMANIDVLMGVSSRFSLYHVLRREKTIEEVVQLGTMGLPYIAGGSGIADMFSLSDADLSFFLSEIERISSGMDYILFDTGAGLSKENLKFITSADQCIVVTTPEPTSITDAYALIKVVHGRSEDTPFNLVVNRAGDEAEARQTSDKIILTARRFLNMEIPMLGSIKDDPAVVTSVKRQSPFYAALPKSNAARDIQRLALRFLAVPPEPDPGRGAASGIKGFMQRLLKRTY